MESRRLPPAISRSSSSASIAAIRPLLPRATKKPASAPTNILTKLTAGTFSSAQDSIDAVARAVGFHYTFDQRQGKFIHPTGVMVLTPDGKFSHNFFGIDAAPADVESAIHDAAAGRVSQVDQPNQQYCVDYDPTLSIRGHRIIRILQTICISFAALLFGYIGLKLTHEIRDYHKRAISPPEAQGVRARALGSSPSPGTPEEGWGEGDFDRTKRLEPAINSLRDISAFLLSKSPSPLPVPGEGEARPATIAPSREVRS